MQLPGQVTPPCVRDRGRAGLGGGGEQEKDSMLENAAPFIPTSLSQLRDPKPQTTHSTFFSQPSLFPCPFSSRCFTCCCCDMLVCFATSIRGRRILLSALLHLQGAAFGGRGRRLTTCRSSTAVCLLASPRLPLYRLPRPIQQPARSRNVSVVWIRCPCALDGRAWATNMRQVRTSLAWARTSANSF